MTLAGSPALLVPVTTNSHIFISFCHHYLKPISLAAAPGNLDPVCHNEIGSCRSTLRPAANGVLIAKPEGRKNLAHGAEPWVWVVIDQPRNGAKDAAGREFLHRSAVSCRPCHRSRNWLRTRSFCKMYLLYFLFFARKIGFVRYF
jgi:hypothetical protein